MNPSTHHLDLFEVEKASVFKVDSPLVQQVAGLTELWILDSFPNNNIVGTLYTTNLTDIIIQTYIVLNIIYMNIILPANTIDVLIVYCRLSILALIRKNNTSLRIKAKRYYTVNIAHLNLTLGKLFAIIFYIYFIIKGFKWSVLVWFNTATELDYSVVVTAACIFFLLWSANSISNAYYAALKVATHYILTETYITTTSPYKLLFVLSTIIIPYLRSTGSDKPIPMLFRLLGTLILYFLKGLDSLFCIKYLHNWFRAGPPKHIEDDFVCRVISHILSIATVTYIYRYFLRSIGLGDVQVVSSVIYGLGTILYDILTLNLL